MSIAGQSEVKAFAPGFVESQELPGSRASGIFSAKIFVFRIDSGEDIRAFAPD